MLTFAGALILSFNSQVFLCSVITFRRTLYVPFFKNKQAIYFLLGNTLFCNYVTAILINIEIYTTLTVKM